MFWLNIFAYVTKYTPPSRIKKLKYPHESISVINKNIYLFK